MMYQIHKLLRLCRRQTVLQYKRFNHVCATNGDETKNKSEKRVENKDFTTLLQNHRNKITFSSYLDHEKLELGNFKYYLKTIKQAKRNQQKENDEKSLPPLPVSLRYYVAKERLLTDDTETTQAPTQPEKAFQLPFASTTPVTINKNDSQPHSNTQSNTTATEKEFDRSNIRKWMTNYEHFDDSKLESAEDEEDLETLENEWSKQYGTPDPKAAVSRVPCGGCGALLHCSDPAIPGYLPSEIFKHRNEVQLKSMECQRCHFLKEYNIALDVRVQPEEYEKLLQSIRCI